MGCDADIVKATKGALEELLEAAFRNVQEVTSRGEPVNQGFEQAHVLDLDGHRVTLPSRCINPIVIDSTKNGGWKRGDGMRNPVKRQVVEMGLRGIEDAGVDPHAG